MGNGVGDPPLYFSLPLALSHHTWLHCYSSIPSHRPLQIFVLKDCFEDACLETYV